MTILIAGGVDCDLHPAVPHLTSLLPYLNDYWRDQVTTRGMVDLVSQSYPPNSPISARPDWRPAQGKPGSQLSDLQAQALDPFQVAFGICNPLFGVQMVFSEDMQDAFCRALNDWLAREWLDKDTRLRGSIVIPTQSVEKSVAEIERCARDLRFVQVLVLVMGDMPPPEGLALPCPRGPFCIPLSTSSKPMSASSNRQRRCRGAPALSVAPAEAARWLQTQSICRARVFDRNQSAAICSSRIRHTGTSLRSPPRLPVRTIRVEPGKSWNSPTAERHKAPEQ